MCVYVQMCMNTVWQTGKSPFQLLQRVCYDTALDPLKRAVFSLIIVFSYGILLVCLSALYVVPVQA